MKASELRIGNWVQSGNDSPFQVNRVHVIDIDDDMDGENTFPITLSEEWLLKLGINKRIIKTQLNGSEDWFDVSRVLVNDDIDNPKWGYLFSMNGESLTVIKYVHQLQNLYFALTGAELALSENK